MPAVIKSQGVIFGEKPWGYFKGWLKWGVNKKMAQARKWVLGKMKF
jgi:hypothetical protein